MIYRDLPESIRADLQKMSLSRISPLGRFYATEHGAGKIAGIVIGAVILGIVAWSSTWSEVWSLNGAGWAAAISIVGAMLVVFNWLRFVRFRKSGIRPGFVATPILMGTIGLEHEPVSLMYHKDLVDVDITHHHRNGIYSYTSFYFKFKTGGIPFTLSSKTEAEGLLAYLRSTPDTIRSWVAQGTADEMIGRLDWISAARAVPVADRGKAAPARTAWDSGWVKLGLSAALGVLVAGGAYGYSLVRWEHKEWTTAAQINTPESYAGYLRKPPLGWHRKEAEERKDDRSYDRAVASKKAGGMRDYLKTFPQGRHADEARQGLRDLYARAEAAYLEKATKAAKADPQATEGMKALLGYLRERDRPFVGIAFTPGAPIDDKKLHDVAEADTGSSKVRTPGASFSAERNRERESRIIAVMKASFQSVFSDDLFDLSTNAPAADDPRFLVQYRVGGSGSIYTWEHERSLPAEQRECFVGIKIDFDFALQIPASAHPPDPDPHKGFCFSMAVNPAPNMTVAGEGTTAVYDRMADTSFEKFEVDLANAYGLERVMPENWGKLPETAGRSHRPYVPDTKFDWSKYKIPDIHAPGKDLFPSKSADEIIDRIISDKQTEMILNPDTKDPTEDEVFAEVKRRAKFGIQLPDDATIRQKIREKMKTYWLMKALMKKDK